MKKIYARKPCSFGGRKFFVGDPIPEDAVADLNAQIRFGVIAVADNETGTETGEVSIPVSIDGEVQNYLVTPEQIGRSLKILQSDVKTAVSLVADELDDRVLVLTKNIDSRKMVRESVEKQLVIISDIEDGNDVPTSDNGKETASETAASM